MNPEAHEIERGLGASLRAMLAAWLVLTVLQVMYAGSFMLQMHYFSERSWQAMPSWLPGLRQALRLAVLPPLVVLGASALRYARATLAGDRMLALLGGCALLLAFALDLTVAARESLDHARLWESTRRWYDLQRKLWIAQALIESAGLGLLGVALARGGRLRGGRTAEWMVLPLVVRGVLPVMLYLAHWFPDWRKSSQVLLVHGGLMLAFVVAALLFARLLWWHARVVPVAERPAHAAVQLRSHASAMLARLVVLVGVAVLTVLAARSRSLDMLKFVLVVGPLAALVIGLWLLAASTGFAWASVSGTELGLAAHLAVALLAATVLIELHGLVLICGLFWGQGSIMRRAEGLQQVAPMLSLAGQVLGVVALVALLRALARVGAAHGVPDAAGRALRIGGALLGLVVAATLLQRRTQVLGARPDGAGALLLFGVLLLAGAIALFVAYIKLVRETAEALGPARPRW